MKPEFALGCEAGILCCNSLGIEAHYTSNYKHLWINLIWPTISMRPKIPSPALHYEFLSHAGCRTRKRSRIPACHVEGKGRVVFENHTALRQGKTQPLLVRWTTVA